MLVLFPYHYQSFSWFLLQATPGAPPPLPGYTGLGVQFSSASSLEHHTDSRDDIMSSSFVVTSPPRHTLRHRPPGVLPTHEDSAEDLDNLDDVCYWNFCRTRRWNVLLISCRLVQYFWLIIIYLYIHLYLFYIQISFASCKVLFMLNMLKFVSPAVELCGSHKPRSAGAVWPCTEWSCRPSSNTSHRVSARCYFNHPQPA